MLGRASVEGLRRRGEDVEADSIALLAPKIRALRKSDGTLVAFGLRLSSAETSPKDETTAAEQGVPAEESKTTPSQSDSADESSMTWHLGRVELSEVQVDWSDASVEPPVHATALVDAVADGLVLGHDAQPARVDLTVHIPGSLETPDAKGELLLGNERELKLEIAARGMKAGALASYLPPGIHSTLTKGFFGARLKATLGRHPEAGSSILLEASD